MGWLSPQRYATEFETQTAGFVAEVARHDLTAVVPTCPEWTYRDLVMHVGSGHRYATELITSGADGPRPLPKIEPPDAWGDWLVDGAGLLTAAVTKGGFDQRVWTWQPAFQTAGFWLRRMMHDEIIHRFDADPATRVTGDLAVDGVTDMLETLGTLGGRPWMAGLVGTGETLQFRMPGGAWHATLTPAGVQWHEGEAPADETVATPDLLLVLNRRLPATDPGPIFTRWLANSRF